MWCPRVNNDFLTSLIEWEIKIAAHEVACGDKVIDAVQVTTIMDHAPELMKATLCQSPLDQRRSVDALKLWIREGSYVLPGLFQGQVPVQACAAGDGGKGKKGKGERSNGRTAMAATARIATTTIGTQASRQRSSKAVAPTAKWGHKRAECRTRLAQQNTGAVAGDQKHQKEGHIVKSVHWSNAENDEMEIDASSDG